MCVLIHSADAFERRGWLHCTDARRATTSTVPKLFCNGAQTSTLSQGNVTFWLLTCKCSADPVKDDIFVCRSGNTPLLEAMSNNGGEVVMLLLEQGADVAAQNKCVYLFCYGLDSEWPVSARQYVVVLLCVQEGSDCVASGSNQW